ncbi:Uncharacterized protein TCM_038544 [Theobroma cacao]|uniref:Uncharacterized protein n=1 Tax=Theobroma cacao TaxID=3641 RepID=A0A061GPY6_THECC|nr:Uncharacterized protein TCM_038544 [Theobroma cacao]
MGELKRGIMEMLEDFHKSATFDHKINTSFITLVPKNNNLIAINEYWLIILAASGLKVNFHKSCLFGIVIHQDIVEEWAGRIARKVGKLPITYLGLLLGVVMNSIRLWKLVVDKFETRLSTWKAQSLSLGGIKEMLDKLQR